MIPYQAWKKELLRPAPYQPGAPFWTDGHIAGELLKEHLRPDTDAGSYRPETRSAICQNLQTYPEWQPGKHVADLGCGPGLYVKRLADTGVTVTGIDQSQNSLAYARELRRNTTAQFLNASYLTPFGSDAFDAAMMISQDYGVLSPENRRALLANVYTALHPGGRFALDVASLCAYRKLGNPASAWETAEEGLWQPHPYAMLHAVHLYPELSALCDLYAVLDDTVTVYRIWQTFFSPQTITKELSDAGFAVEAVWADLAAGPWGNGAPALGILCRKPE